MQILKRNGVSSGRILCFHGRNSDRCAPSCSFWAGNQLSPSVLSSDLNNSDYGESPDFAVNPLALHQGFHLFKKSIRKLGHTLIQMGCKGLPSVVEFMGLPEADIGWDIIFFNDTDRNTLILKHELLMDI